MILSDTIHIRVAQVLRIIVYVALAIISLSLILEISGIKYSSEGVIGGISLVVAAPLSGVITVLIVSISTGNKRNLATSAAILLIFILALAVSL